MEFVLFEKQVRTEDFQFRIEMNESLRQDNKCYTGVCQRVSTNITFISSTVSIIS